MIVDALVHLGRSHFGSELSSAEAVAQMAAAGTDVAVVAPAHPGDRDFGAANDAVLDAAAGSPALVPLVRIDPWADGASAELSRVASRAAGVFLHPSEEHFHVNDASLVRPLVEQAAGLGLPVVIAAGFHLVAEPLQFGDVAGWVPGHPIVLTNGGQFNISGGSQFDVELMLEQNPGLHVHTTAMYRQDFLERVVALRGAERLLFASAAPAFDMQFERARADLAHLSPDERALVMGGNAVRIFSIGGPR